MTFGYTANMGENASALACTPVSCEVVSATPDDLLPAAAALNGTTSDPSSLEASLQIIGQLARQQSAKNLRPEVESLHSGNGHKLALSDYGELFFATARNLTEAP